MTLALVGLALAGCPGGGDMNGDGGDAGGDVVRSDVPRTDTGGGNDTGTTDSGTTSETGVTDSGTEAGRNDGSAGDGGGFNLFGPCAADADCGGMMGTFCLPSWPGGICIKQCANDRACGNNGICFQNICLPRCSPTQQDDTGTITTPGGGECDGKGELCFQIDQLDPTRGACFPSCNQPMDPGAAACPTSAPTCDLYSGNCIDPNDPTMVSSGDDNGAPCMTDAQGGTMCRGGRCIDELNSDGTASGFVGGYCFSVGIQLDEGVYQSDMPLLRSNCPTGSVVLPDDPTRSRPGDPAICWKECTANSDCRAGYECFEFPQPDAGNFFTSGACLPIDCNDDTWRPATNNGCPATHFCNIDPTDMRGTCTPNNLRGDAGGVDAGPADTGSGSTDAGTAIDSGSTDTDAGSAADASDGSTFLSLTACPLQSDYTNTPTTVAFGGTTLGLTYSPKCLEVNAGSTVTFMGDFSMHPLAGDTPQGGPVVNPITNPLVPTATSTTATFLQPGFYPYHCTNHGTASGTGMAGVIWVK